MSGTRGTLKDQGFRFVHRGDEFKWVHPAELQDTDHDCTDMNDVEFCGYVMAVDNSAIAKATA